MPIKNDERVINGRTFHSTQFGAVQALGLSVRLGKVLGPAIAELFGSSADKSAAMQKDARVLIAYALAHADHREIVTLVQDLLKNTSAVENDKLVPLDAQTRIDAIFSGDLASMMSAVAFVVELNFGNFFADVSAKSEQSEETTNATQPSR